MKLTNATRKRRMAFTLIELIVVVTIIGILAALIVPKIVNRAGDAKVKSAKSDLATIRDMLQSFKIDVGRYPTTQEGLSALVTAPSDSNGWKGPYTDQPSFTDPWGTLYDYECPGPNGPDSFTLRSYGADGVPGGDGDSADIDVNDLGSGN